MYGNLIEGMILLGGASAAGILKSQELTERVRRLQEFQRMIIFIRGEFRFHRAALSEAFERVAGKMTFPFREFLTETARELEEGQEVFEELWERKTKELLKVKGFRRGDESLFEVLGGGLGYLDLELQMDSLEMVLERTGEAIALAREEEQCRGKLYRSIGVTTGMLLALMIV